MKKNVLLLWKQFKDTLSLCLKDAEQVESPDTGERLFLVFTGMKRIDHKISGCKKKKKKIPDVVARVAFLKTAKTGGLSRRCRLRQSRGEGQYIQGHGSG